MIMMFLGCYSEEDRKKNGRTREGEYSAEEEADRTEGNESVFPQKSLIFIIF